MGLQFKPLPVEEHRARWPLALDRLFNLDTLRDDQPRPGLCRANVFDFEGGLRLIASREALWGHTALHASASFPCRMLRGGPLEPVSRQDYEAAWKALEGVSGRHDWRLAGVIAGIPHWLIDLNDDLDC
jgi:hypothetical protein